MSWLNARFASLMKRHFACEDESFFLELMQSAREGHLCLMKKRAPFVLPETSDKDSIPLQPIVRRGDRYYLQRNWVYETAICCQLYRLHQSFGSLETSFDRKELLPA